MFNIWMNFYHAICQWKWHSYLSYFLTFWVSLQHRCFNVPIASSTAALWPRVHILGLGSIGTFAAHSISQIFPGPSVVLLLHRESLLEAHRLSGNQIRFESREGEKSASRGYGLEVFSNGSWYTNFEGHQSHDKDITHDSIANLVICVKATQTVKALRSLGNRLTRDSNILFLQNGAGMIEEVNHQLFPDPTSRPSFWLVWFPMA